MSNADFNKVFSRRLRLYMAEYNMTQAELAKRLGVGATSVYNWYNGVKTPRMDKVDKMCEIFHCKRSDLIEDKPAAVPSSDGHAESKGFSDDNSLHLSKSNEFGYDKPLHQDESKGFYDTERLLAEVRKYGTDTPEQRAALSAALDSMPIPDDKRELMKGVLELDPDQAAAFLAFAKTVVKRP